jgi:tetratricopeptide (TPR) repeat protein
MSNSPRLQFFAFWALPAACVAFICFALFSRPDVADDRAECIKAAGEEAIGACSRLISSGNIGDFAALAFYSRGMAYIQKPDFDAAMNDFNETLRIDSKMSPAYTGRGMAYWMRGKPDLAAADWNEAIRLGPIYQNPYLNSLPYMYRGTLYYAGRHEYERAVADLDQAIQVDPKNGQAFSNRGWAFGQLGQFERSIADLDIAIKLTPNLAKAYSNRGFALGELGQTDRAISDFDTAIRLDPNDPQGWSKRGTMYGAKGQFDRAMADLNEAVRLNPKSTEWLVNRARVELAMKEPERVVADANQAISLDPESVRRLFRARHCSREHRAA